MRSKGADVVKLLLTDGRAGPAANNSLAIQLSSQEGTEVVKLLLVDGRVDPAADNNHAIQLSSQEGHIDVVQLLVDGHVDRRRQLCDPIEQRRGTQEWCSCCLPMDEPTPQPGKTMLGVVKLLLADGRADPTADDNAAIRLSSQNGHTDVVKLLLGDRRLKAQKTDFTEGC